MKAQDIMTRDVIAVQPDTPVHSIAAQMTEKRISGVPVVNAEGELLGIVSESDLLHRAELGTERKRKWWLSLFGDPDQMARDFAKTHGFKAQDVMTRSVVSVSEDTDIKEVANTLDTQRVKRLPVIRDGKLVGIITRSDLVRALSRTEMTPSTTAPLDDATIHANLTRRMREQEWLDSMYLNATVTNGVVELHGFIASVDRRRALRVLVEETPGVRGIDDHLVVGIPAASAV